MKKYIQRAIKNMVADGFAKKFDGDFSMVNDFLHSHTIEKIGYSSGIYGINGCLFKDSNTGDLYAITARNTALMMIF